MNGSWSRRRIGFGGGSGLSQPVVSPQQLRVLIDTEGVLAPSAVSKEQICLSFSAATAETF